MQQEYSATLSLTGIERPRCPKCDGRMSTAKITFGRHAPNIRMFECEGCRHIHIARAEVDPMQSDAVLWLAGHDLRSPT
jgi:hypothetical protein